MVCVVGEKGSEVERVWVQEERGEGRGVEGGVAGGEEEAGREVVAGGGGNETDQTAYNYR